MPASPRATPGFTLIELLVVIAIIAILVALLMPPVQDKRQCLNQDTAAGAMQQIASAQSVFRNLNSDGDAVDDYGTLFELGGLGLLDPDIADGEREGYLFSILTTPTPHFEAQGIPAVRCAGIQRFYVDETSGVRFSLSGTPGPFDPLVTPGGECVRTEDPACDLAMEAIAKIGVLQLDALGGGGNVDDAAEQVSTPGFVGAALAALDVDGDLQVSAAEVLSLDLLGVARSVVVALDLPSGPSVGDDDDLRAILTAMQDAMGAELALDLDPPQPLVPVSDLSTEPTPAVQFLLDLSLTPVPALEALGAVLLLVSLIALGVWRLAEP